MNDWNTGVVYELAIRTDGNLIHMHRFKPKHPHLDNDLESMRWHAVQAIKERGLTPSEPPATLRHTTDKASPAQD